MEQQVQSSNAVLELIATLKDSRRTKPVCVISIAAAEDTPGFDVPHLIAEADGMADFYVIKTGDLTREFAAGMPADTQVFGGAARAYPIDFASSKVAGQLRYPIPPTQLKKATAALISDIWGFAHAAGLIAKPAAGLKAETVSVEAIYGGETAVLLRANGERVSLRSEAAFPGIPLDRVLAKGQKLEGFYDPKNRAFAFASQNPSMDDVVEHFGFETVTLGLVRAADRKTATVALHPNLAFEVSKKEITGNDQDVVNEYFNVGQVYSFRIYRDPQGHTRLRCNDIDDDEPVAPALALLPGGSPWLEEGLGIVGQEVAEPAEDLAATELDLPTEEAVDETVAALTKQLAEMTAALEAASAQTNVPTNLLSNNAFFVNHLRGQVLAANKEAQRAKDEADAIAAERNTLVREIVQLKAHNKELGNEVSERRKAMRGAVNHSERNRWETLGQFESAAEWLREEVRRAWIDTFKASDRKQFNLEAISWSFGPKFFDGFNEQTFDETKLRKIIRTVVELVSTRSSVPGSTEAHPLSDNFKGQVRREDAGAMRMYVEEKTPGALRLHYWKIDKGGFELNGVESHDTFTMR